jgi:diadenylate cyclase
MNGMLMMKAAADIAGTIGARALVSFLEPFDFQSDVPVIWVRELQLDVLKELTMQDILEVSERHLLDAAVQIYLSRQYEEGKVVGIFHYAIVIFDIKEGKDFVNVKEFEDIVPRDVMHAVMTLALEIGLEGREGHAVGTAFIIGEGEAILKHSHQAILNPFQGQDPENCDIRNKDNWESVKEFAQLDGIFVVSPAGCILAAGRYLDVNASTIKLPGGLGGRHRAAAAITREVPVIGVTVSESGGIVRVFRDGKCHLSLRSDLKLTDQSP